MSYIILKGEWWYHIIVLNIHASIEDKMHVKSVLEGIRTCYQKFSKCCMKILLANFSAKVDKEDIFKPTTLS
jgi:hypothetical protein